MRRSPNILILTKRGCEQIWKRTQIVHIYKSRQNLIDSTSKRRDDDKLPCIQLNPHLLQVFTSSSSPKIKQSGTNRFIKLCSISFFFFLSLVYAMFVLLLDTTIQTTLKLLSQTYLQHIIWALYMHIHCVPISGEDCFEALFWRDENDEQGWHKIKSTLGGERRDAYPVEWVQTSPSFSWESRKERFQVLSWSWHGMSSQSFLSLSLSSAALCIIL